MQGPRRPATSATERTAALAVVSVQGQRRAGGFVHRAAAGTTSPAIVVQSATKRSSRFMLRDAAQTMDPDEACATTSAVVTLSR